MRPYVKRHMIETTRTEFQELYKAQATWILSWGNE